MKKLFVVLACALTMVGCAKVKDYVQDIKGPQTVDSVAAGRTDENGRVYYVDSYQVWDALLVSLKELDIAVDERETVKGSLVTEKKAMSREDIRELASEYDSGYNFASPNCEKGLMQMNISMVEKSLQETEIKITTSIRAYGCRGADPDKLSQRLYTSNVLERKILDRIGINLEKAKP